MFIVSCLCFPCPEEHRSCSRSSMSIYGMKEQELVDFQALRGVRVVQERMLSEARLPTESRWVFTCFLFTHLTVTSVFRVAETC